MWLSRTPLHFDACCFHERTMKKKKIGLEKFEIEGEKKTQMSVEEKELWPLLLIEQCSVSVVIWIALFGDKWIRVLCHKVPLF
ncbi:hypothetical protein A2U01_0048013 [Trifolium medium]|uniref:Uncharacterized protein n=1 Tax=Trifolium medium TaxID=97028 RepID=A0A392QTF8_9FABA|nr:hypothetical protein [Trifolium medium]